MFSEVFKLMVPYETYVDIYLRQKRAFYKEYQDI